VTISAVSNAIRRIGTPQPASRVPHRRPRPACEGILRRLRKSNKPADRLAHDPKQFEKILAETRQRGYGTRDPIFTGGFYGSTPIDDGLAGIAVPLLDRTRVHGSINLLWIRTAFTVQDFAARYLADLQGAAAEIVDSLRQQPGYQRAR
jgi:IclR family transcriptional regulator, mhp operon transcriptional activator